MVKTSLVNERAVSWVYSFVPISLAKSPGVEKDQERLTLIVETVFVFLLLKMTCQRPLIYKVAFFLFTNKLKRHGTRTRAATSEDVFIFYSPSTHTPLHQLQQHPFLLFQGGHESFERATRSVRLHTVLGWRKCVRPGFIISIVIFIFIAPCRLEC